MTGIGFDLAAMLDAFRSLCRKSGGFDFVSAHELRKAPAARFSLGAWLAGLRPIPGRSGLASTSLRVLLQARIYMPLQGDPDQLDTEMARRVDLIWSALHGDITITAAEHEVDILGAYGDPILADSGWLPMPDNTPVRVADLFVPIIVNDAYAQVRQQ
jgi:hypothetical protein